MASLIEIHAAADSLAEKGVRVTQAELRVVLGGGSYSTIGAALKTWPNRPKKLAEVVRAAAPTFVSDEANRFASAVWEAARNMANEELITERTSMAISYAALESEQRDAEHLVDTLDAQLRVATEQRIALDAEKVALDEMTKKLMGSLGVAESREAQANAALAETKLLVGVLSSDIERVRTASGVERREAKVQHDAVTSDSQRLATELQERSSKLASAERMTAQAESALAETRVLVDVLNKELMRERNTLERIRAEAKSSGESAAELRGRLGEFTAPADI